MVRHLPMCRIVYMHAKVKDTQIRILYTWIYFCCMGKYLWQTTCNPLYMLHAPSMFMCACVCDCFLGDGFFVTQRGWSPLHIACSKGMTEIVDLLLCTGKKQKNYCGKKMASDCEAMINAKEKSKVRTILKCKTAFPRFYSLVWSVQL